ncbi:MAG TPA: hypothetical protein VIF40_12930 [Methylosinus sp.]|jgi:hypothetical protein|uniref:hypothetical protein n=1 Tax=Methylosinus sp. TaxID=427 RepID=UPI002F959020
MSAPLPDPLTAEAAGAYRAMLPKRRGRETAPQRDAFSREMLRAHILEMLGPIPADALAAFVALDLGDDDLAYDYLAAVVQRVREAAHSMNELRRAAERESE